MRGILKGWDPLVNLVLDEAVEEMRGTFCLPWVGAARPRTSERALLVLRLLTISRLLQLHPTLPVLSACIPRAWISSDANDPYRQSGKERKLGLMVARGTSVMTISPVSGMHQLIENPFLERAGEE